MQANNEKGRYILITIATVFLILGGLINMLLLKKFKQKCDKSYYKLWAILTHTKLLITLFIFSPFGKLILSNEILKTTKIVLIFGFIMVGVFSKNLRELAPKYSNK